MEVNLNNIQNPAPATNNNLAGVTAPQTESQRLDQSATRVVANKESAKLEDNASSSDERRIDAIKSRAAKFIGGKNSFLSDIKFTVYGQKAINSGIGDYVIRFTDLSSGKVEVKNEAQLFEGTGGGDLVSGQV